MNENQKLWIAKAKENISAAKEMAELGYPGISVTRSYYAMFYLAQALLLERNLVFSKHSGVIASFGQHFVKTGLIDPKFHQYLREAQEERLLGDYDLFTTFTKEEASEQAERANEFLNMTISLFEK